MFHHIVLRDLSKPIRERHSKHVGPYTWEPTDAAWSKGFGFYTASGKGLRMDRAGSRFDLRLEYANDLLDSYSRLAGITGYYCDEFQDSTMIPIVARLPHGRGFLAGWTMGQGMCASLSSYIHETERDAAIAAHDDAESAAQREQEYQARMNAEDSEEEE
jgi:hypothetical protein